VGLIRTLELARPRIIGLSQGGSTALHLAAEYPELVQSFIVEGWGVDASPGDMVKSEGFRDWSRQFLAWLQRLKTMSHEERLVAALPYLVPATGGRLWPEEEYVPEVEGYVLLDLDLVRDNSPIWTNQEQDILTELLKRISCPALIMQHSFAFPAPGTQPTFREVPSEQANVKIVYFENTGHLIRHVAFDQYMDLVRAFLKEY
jgi:pimeloyl-ACP methyl ester carboxylesterase